jgi:hypothetical protein
MTEAEWESEDAAKLPAGWWTRRWMRAEPWPLLLVALLLLLAYCWWYSSPRVAMVALNYYGDFCYGFLLFGAVAAGRGVQMFVAPQCARRHGLSFQEVRSRHRFWPWLAAVVAITFGAVRQEVPMHACFVVSQPWFDALADEALADPGNAHRLTGRWAGGYRVAGVEVIGETVVIYLDRPEGNYGFARVPGAKSDHIYNMPHSPGGLGNHQAFPPYSGRNFTDPVGDRIAGDWFVVYSSYWRVKVGPS